MGTLRCGGSSSSKQQQQFVVTEAASGRAAASAITRTIAVHLGAFPSFLWPVLDICLACSHTERELLINIEFNFVVDRFLFIHTPYAAENSRGFPFPGIRRNGKGVKMAVRSSLGVNDQPAAGGRSPKEELGLSTHTHTQNVRLVPPQPALACKLHLIATQLGVHPSQARRSHNVTLFSNLNQGSRTKLWGHSDESNRLRTTRLPFMRAKWTCMQHGSGSKAMAEQRGSRRFSAACNARLLPTSSTEYYCTIPSWLKLHNVSNNKRLMMTIRRGC